MWRRKPEKNIIIFTSPNPVALAPIFREKGRLLDCWHVNMGGEKKEKKEEKEKSDEEEFEEGVCARRFTTSRFTWHVVTHVQPMWANLWLYRCLLVGAASERTLQQVELGDFVKVKQILDEAVVKAVRSFTFLRGTASFLEVALCSFVGSGHWLQGEPLLG
jgi:hypothetical protein